jgi:hypothetical protein
MSREIKWLDEPEHHDFVAAFSVLSLKFSFKHAAQLVHDLHEAPLVKFKAKDIVRMSGEPVLSEKNSHVEHVLEKIDDRKRLSPILLVRTPEKLLIADGYHRVCAVYLHDEDHEIPARIAGDVP